MSSSLLLRTNPRLTANVTVVIDSRYGMFLESIDSDPALSADRYKAYRLTEDSNLSEQIPFFFTATPADIAYAVKGSTNTSTFLKEYSLQYDPTYWAGGEPLTSQWYPEEFSYFAPLYIDRNDIPQAFVVLRLDGPGSSAVSAEQTKAEMLDSVLVNMYVLDSTTQAGRMLRSNIENELNPKSPLELSYLKYGFSRWSGISFDTGGYCSKSKFINDDLRRGLSHYDMEELLTDGFAELGVIDTSILNLTFLFDDQPSTFTTSTSAPTENMWSLNRYVGFYVRSLNKVKQVSPFIQNDIKQGIYISNNVFLSDYSDDTTWVDPIVEGWSDSKKYYIKVGDKFHLLGRRLVSGSYKYSVISDESIDTGVNTVGEYVYYDRPVALVPSVSENRIYLNNLPGGYTHIPEPMQESMLCIEILGKYYALHFDSATSRWYIKSNDLIYTDVRHVVVITPDEQETSVDFTDVTGSEPLVFTIYSMEMLPVEDLDYDRVDTRFSRFELEATSGETNTAEPKLYMRDGRLVNSSDDIYTENEYVLRGTVDVGGDDDGTLVPFVIPVSSEYVSDEDLWSVRDGQLSQIWDKNPKAVKWGCYGSMGHAESPYKANVSAWTSGAANMSPDITVNTPNRASKNLDWFYTVGAPMTQDTTKDVDDTLRYSESEYTYSTLCVNPQPVESSYDKEFWLYSWFNCYSHELADSGFDYFSAFFGNRPSECDYGTSLKWSEFINDGYYGSSHTVFKGARWILWERTQSDSTAGIPFDASGYKFSAVATKQFTSDTGLHGKSGIRIVVNTDHRNVLVMLCLYVPYGSMTNIEHTTRDAMYAGGSLVGSSTYNDLGYYCYDINEPGSITTQPAYKLGNAAPTMFTLFNVANAINDPDSYSPGFDIELTYVSVGTDKTFFMTVETADEIPVEKPVITRTTENLQPVNRKSNMAKYINTDDALASNVYDGQPLTSDISYTLSDFPTDDAKSIMRMGGPHTHIHKPVTVFYPSNVQTYPVGSDFENFDTVETGSANCSAFAKNSDNMLYLVFNSEWLSSQRRIMVGDLFHVTSSSGEASGGYSSIPDYAMDCILTVTAVDPDGTVTFNYEQTSSVPAYVCEVRRVMQVSNSIMDVDSSEFAKTAEVIFSKASHLPYQQLATGDNIQSIYAMVDETGVSYDRLNVFESTWSNTYHRITRPNKYTGGNA